MTTDAERLVRWFTKIHECECGNSWEDEWNCLCDDECSECGTDVSPTAYTWALIPLTDACAAVNGTPDEYQDDTGDPGPDELALWHSGNEDAWWKFAQEGFSGADTPAAIAADAALAAGRYLR